MQSYYSNIYWHFTGGPEIDWETVRMPKEIKGNKKPCAKSVDILNKIIASRKLLATCTEKILGDLRTNKFCCVCDIPFKDLIYHAEYYGKVAIGFSSEAIHKNFNPVLYTERDFPIPQTLEIDENTLLDENKEFETKDPAFEFFSYILGLEQNPSYQAFLSNYLGYFKQFIKVTRFSKDDDETFYREREWRSRDGDFSFTLNDIEAVIIPKAFISDFKKRLLEDKIYMDIPIIHYEFLESI